VRFFGHRRSRLAPCRHPRHRRFRHRGKIVTPLNARCAYTPSQEEWSRVDLAVEEFLGFITPVQFTKPRYVRKDIELGGVRLRKGDRIMVMLAAANMDPRSNAYPERLDLQRKPNRHIAFGTGIHFCLGHQLARIEGRCALKALFQRWPTLALAIDES